MSEPQTDRVSAVKAKYESELMARPGVVGVGVGLRQRGGERTDEVVIVVMVQKKLPPDQLPPNERIPPQLEGVPVDVQEVGNILAR